MPSISTFLYFIQGQTRSKSNISQIVVAKFVTGKYQTTTCSKAILKGTEKFFPYFNLVLKWVEQKKNNIQFYYKGITLMFSRYLKDM